MVEKTEKRLIQTPVGRVSFPSVYQKNAFGNGEAKFRLTLLIPKALKGPEKKLYDALVDAANKVSMEAFKCKVGELVKGRGVRVKSPFLDAGEKEGVWGGYDDSLVYIRFSNKVKPRVVDARVQDISEESQLFYAGCYAKAMCNPYAYDKDGGLGISFSLGNIQKVAEGEPFGAAQTNPEDEFEVIEEVPDASLEDLVA